jgi:hypothetical protein
MNAWIVRLSVVQENVTEGKDIEANTESVGLREDNTQRADFQDSDMATFWREATLECPILSCRPLKLPIPFSTRYRCRPGFSVVVSTKTNAHKLNWIFL